MKRRIIGDTRPEIIQTIKQGFINAGCTHVEVIEQTSDHCDVKMRLPKHGKVVNITVWYSSKKVKNGKHIKKTKLPWSRAYKVTPNGEVYKGSTLIGTAVVLTIGEEVDSYKTDYVKDSIRMNTGDIEIDYLELRNSYQDVVDLLDRRTVNVRE